MIYKVFDYCVPNKRGVQMVLNRCGTNFFRNKKNLSSKPYFYILGVALRVFWSENGTTELVEALFLRKRHLNRPSERPYQKKTPFCYPLEQNKIFTNS